MKGQIKLFLAISITAVVLVSSLLVYANINLNPAGSQTGWQRPIENFATGLAADNSQVYVGDIFGNVGAFSTQNGASVWNSSADTGYFAGGLVQSGDRVYGGGSMASVGCLDKASGMFQWSFEGIINTDLWWKRAPDEIIVSDRVVAAINGGVSVHDATTGEFLWQASRPYGYPPADFGNITDLSTWWVAAYPLGGNSFEGKFVYALTGNYSNPYISKFDWHSHSFVWNSSITLSSFPIAYPEGIPGYSGNAVSVIANYQGQIVVENENQILCLDQTSGEKLWSRDIDASIYQPTISGDALYFGASDGNLYALNLTDGTQLWKTKVDSQNLMPTVNGGNITLTTYPIQVEGGSLYWSFGVTHQLGTNSGNKHDTYTGAVCSLDIATGKVVWTEQFEDSGVLYNPPVGMVVNKGTVFLTENTVLWTFSASNGNLAGRQQFDHYVLPPVKAGDQVYVAGDLYLIAYA
jgi:outer membrane protein assembly factor BamB